MQLKKSAILLLALTVSSLSLLVFSSNTIISPVSPPSIIKCSTQMEENEPVSQWDIMSRSIFR